MSYSCIPPQAYTSMIKFTIDGRPSVEDIQDLFSALATQLTFGTHRYMFRTYTNSFTSEEALQQLSSIKFTKLKENEGIYSQNTTATTTTFNMNRDMGKALIQQFIWTRLIENSVDPLNRNYKDKGIWRLSSKGLCILQDFCLRSGADVEQFLDAVDVTSRLMFLIQVDRLPENDRINCKRRYISSLFAMLIASLPLRQNNQKEAKILKAQNPVQSPRYQHQDGSDDSYSVYSNDSSSTYSSSANHSSRLPQFADYFPKVKTLSNDLLVGTGIKQPHQVHKIAFQQQKVLLQNLNPAFNRFRMRAIFTSFLCCTWLIEYCTFASTDEAETLMTEFLNLGWVEFYNEKDKELTQIECSKSILLNVTREGMKVVIDYSRDRYNDFQEKLNNSSAIEKQLSAVSLSSDDVYGEPYHQPFAPIDENSSLSDDNQYNPNYSAWTRAPSSLSNGNHDSYAVTSTPSIHSYARDFSYGYFDLDTISSLTTASSLSSTPSESIKSHSNISTPPLTPTTPTSADIFSARESGNSFKLKAILINPHLRPLFRDFLANNFCVENLDFWIDHDSLRRNYQRQKTNMSSANQKLLLEDAYIIWDAYLKPGAAHELNIDHNTREEMAKEISFMATVVQTYSLGESTRPEVIMTTHSTYESLMTMLNWLERVNEQICKLMATDSIPKFVRTIEYKQAIQKHDTTQLNQKKPEKLSIVTNDLYDFPSPPQRKVKETIYL